MINFIKRNPIKTALIFILSISIILAFWHFHEIKTHPEIQKALYDYHYKKNMDDFIKEANEYKLPDDAIRANELIEHPEDGKRYLVYGYPICLSGHKFCTLFYPGYNRAIPLQMEHPEELADNQKCIMTYDQKKNWIPLSSCLLMMDGYIKKNDKQEPYFLVKHFMNPQK